MEEGDAVARWLIINKIDNITDEELFPRDSAQLPQGTQRNIQIEKTKTKHPGSQLSRHHSQRILQTLLVKRSKRNSQTDQRRVTCFFELLYRINSNL